MSSVQIAMIGGLPYTALRDAILAHPTLAEGLETLFSSEPTTLKPPHKGRLARPRREVPT
jgi:hypothetical protein